MKYENCSFEKLSCEIAELKERNLISNELFWNVSLSLRGKSFNSHELELRIAKITGDINTALKVLLLEDRYEFVKKITPLSAADLFESEEEMYQFKNKYALNDLDPWDYGELVKLICAELCLPQQLVQKILNCEISYLYELKNLQ